MTFEEISEILSGTGEDAELIFKTYQLGNSDFMDLKKLMAELNIKASNFFNTDNTEADLNMLKKRNENTAFNIYQLKVEEKTKKRPTYKNPLKDIESRVDILLKN